MKFFIHINVFQPIKQIVKNILLFFSFSAVLLSYLSMHKIICNAPSHTHTHTHTHKHIYIYIYYIFNCIYVRMCKTVVHDDIDTSVLEIVKDSNQHLIVNSCP